MRIDAFEKGGSKKSKITEPITRFIQENVDIDCTLSLKKYQTWYSTIFRYVSASQVYLIT